ncbi:hypothetical protein ABIA95_008584 [Bradyrhizobium sp. LA8.1]|jgi:hypothetical protein
MNDITRVAALDMAPTGPLMVGQRDAYPRFRPLTVGA